MSCQLCGYGKSSRTMRHALAKYIQMTPKLLVKAFYTQLNCKEGKK